MMTRPTPREIHPARTFADPAAVEAVARAYRVPYARSVDGELVLVYDPRNDR